MSFGHVRCDGVTDVSRPEVQLAAERNLEHDERPAADAEHTPAATSKAAALLSHNPEHTNREGVSAFVD